jgi:hypothetical protein
MFVVLVVLTGGFLLAGGFLLVFVVDGGVASSCGSVAPWSIVANGVLMLFVRGVDSVNVVGVVAAVPGVVVGGGGCGGGLGGGSGSGVV